MKKMKFVTVFVFIFICLIFIGESFQDVFGSFSSSYAYISVGKGEGHSEDKMVEDLLSAAKDNNIQFFAQNSEIIGPGKKQMTVYYTDEVILGDLEKRFDIKEQNYPSLIVEDMNVKFMPFGEIENIQSIDQLKLIGEDENFTQFQRSIANYRGIDPFAGNGGGSRGDSIVPIWLIAGLAILFLTLYEVQFKKKETYLKIAYGERPIHIILKNILCDTLVMSLMFCLAFFIASRFTYCGYFLQKSLLVFGIILALNGCIYFSIYKGDVKSAFSSSHSSKSFLTLNYGVKIVTMVLTVCVISSNIALISQGMSYLKQESFYEQYKGYSFMSIIEKGGEKYALLDGQSQDKLSYDLYKKYAKSEKVIAQSYFGGNDNTGIYINKNNQEYLQENIKSLKTKDFTENKLYLIVPEDEVNNQEKIESVKGFIEHFLQTGTLSDDKLEIIPYSENVSMLAIDNDPTNLKSYYMDNPIVFFENVQADALGDFYGITDRDLMLTSLEPNLMYDATEDDLINFAKEQGYDTNNLYLRGVDVFDSYIEQVANAKQLVYLNSILSFIILLIEMIIISLIIKMEYSINAVELTVKRVFGYGLMERNKPIILLTLLTCVCATVTALAVNYFIDLTNPINILIGALIIWLLELPAILYNLHKLEKASIQKLLKGGTL